MTTYLLRPSIRFAQAAFTQSNNPIQVPSAGDLLTDIDLTLTLNGGGLVNESFMFGVEFEETNNGANPCPYGGAAAGCNDRVAFANLYDYSNQIVQPGFVCTLVIEGFGSCNSGPAAGPIEFITNEASTNSTCLWATLQDPQNLPVELVSFSGQSSGLSVDLSWEVASETENSGFAIEHAIESDDFRENGFVTGAGSTTETQRYSYEAIAMDPGIHRFRLKQIDFDGTYAFSDEIEVMVAVPNQIVLFPAYPNPFNPQTTIRFAVAESHPVTVTLFNAMGQPVRDLFNGVPEANSTQHLTIDGQGLTSGSYIVRMSSNGTISSQRITLLK